MINLEGSTCMAASCPDATCQERLSQDEIEKIAPDLLAKFKNYQLENFAGAIGRWCPGPGCNRVVCKTLNGTLTNSFVTDCNECGTMFCVDCLEEPHAPVTCEMLQKWKEKDRDEAETVKWMTVNTKHCPNCQTRIEKNGGCQHVTCRKCSHGFCWMCMGTHHVWQCNAYKQDDDSENETLCAKNELEYTRYQAHKSAQKFALNQLKAKSCTVDKFESKEEKNKTSTPFEKPPVNETIPKLDLPDFLQDANRQLVECRRVLKYTYVFAFFHFADRKLKMTQECFESHQGTLEGLTEGLSLATEQPLKTIDRQDVINRTSAIGTFIKNVLAYVDEVVDESG
jgi:ariadne-1